MSFADLKKAWLGRTGPILTVMLPVLCTSVLVSTATARDRPHYLPSAARQVIKELDTAARKRDFPGLRRLMTEEFKWSFGAEVDSRDAAIASWRRDREAMPELQAVLAAGCRRVSAGEVECPGREELGYRAGLTLTGAGWRMKYFIAGD